MATTPMHAQLALPKIKSSTCHQNARDASGGTGVCCVVQLSTRPFSSRQYQQTGVPSRHAPHSTPHDHRTYRAPGMQRPYLPPRTIGPCFRKIFPVPGWHQRTEGILSPTPAPECHSTACSATHTSHLDVDLPNPQRAAPRTCIGDIPRWSSPACSQLPLESGDRREL